VDVVNAPQHVEYADRARSLSHKGKQLSSCMTAKDYPKLDFDRISTINRGACGLLDDTFLVHHDRAMYLDCFRLSKFPESRPEDRLESGRVIMCACS
jgi:hypothetical protein